MSSRRAMSAYPQLAIYSRTGELRRTIDCIPTTRPGVSLVNEPIDLAEGEAVVIAIAAADLCDVQSFGELRAAH
jgi:hypothetical protein